MPLITSIRTGSMTDLSWTCPGLGILPDDKHCRNVVLPAKSRTFRSHGIDIHLSFGDCDERNSEKGSKLKYKLTVHLFSKLWLTSLLATSTHTKPLHEIRLYDTLKLVLWKNQILLKLIPRLIIISIWQTIQQQFCYRETTNITFAMHLWSQQLQYTRYHLFTLRTI